MNLCVAILTALLVLVVSDNTWGQNSATSGTITGIVSDSTGAVVPDAKVTATNDATGVKTPTKTNAVGSFNLPNLPVGIYTVRVEQAGFKNLEKHGILLDPNGVVRVDAALTVGETSQTVSVTEQAPLLESQQVTLDQTIDRQFVASLPNIVSGGIRDITSLLNLAPGVVQGAGSFQTNIGGGRAFQTELLLDGAPMVYTPLASVALSNKPPQDIISEVQVQTGVPSAEWGHNSGGVGSFITRSGTSEFHGDSMILIRNTVLDATPYNSKKKTRDQQFEWPVSVGGPIIIPHLYNGKEKSFFFFNYTAYRTHSSNAPQPTTVATAKERTGDFSELPAGQLIYDPATGLPFAPIPGNPDCINPGRCIPTSRFSAISSQFMTKFIPNPVNTQLVNNYIGNSPSSDKENHYFVKIDQRIGNANTLHGSLRWDNLNVTSPDSPFGPVLGTRYAVQGARGLQISDDTVLGPNLANSVSATYSRWIYNSTATPINLFPVQIPGSYGGGFPSVGFTSTYGSGIGDQNNFLAGHPFWNVNEALSWVKGKHSLKFGARFSDYIAQENQSLGQENGNYSFSPLETGNGTTGLGDAFASFLLGQVDSANLTVGTPIGYSTKYYAFYGQDSWRLTPKLTANIGLRYDVQNPFNAPGSNIMSQTAKNPGAANVAGAIIYTGDQGTGTEFMKTSYGAVGPRVGFAWSATPNTVVRAGYGIMYGPHEYSLARQTFPGTHLSSPAPGTPVVQWDTGYKAGQVVPFSATKNPSISNGQGGIVTLDPSKSGRLMDTQIAQVDVERSWKSILFGAAYLGQFSHHIKGSNGADQVQLANINQIPVSDLKYGALLTKSITDPAVVAAGFTPPYSGFTGTLAQALRTFPQYQSVINQIPIGNSTYHALILRGEKRLSHGLQFLASYTISKVLTDSGTGDYGLPAPQNQYNRKAEKSVATSDIPRVLVLNYVYQLPIGRGKEFANRGLLGTILEGFSISGNQVYEAGSPIAITAPANDLPIFNGYLAMNRGTGPFTTGNRRNIKIGNPLYGTTGTTYLNKAAFALPPAPTDPTVIANPNLGLGNLKLVLPNVRNLGYFNENLSLVKRQRIHDQYTFEIGFDMIDAFNRRNFGGLNTNYGSSTFGTYGGASDGPRHIQLNSKITF